jgi:8-oxoguanine deaminase
MGACVPVRYWKSQLAAARRSLGPRDIGSLEVGKCADFFTLDLNCINFAGGLSDPVSAVLFCAPTRALHTVVAGRAIVRDGSLVTIDMPAIIAEHNRHAGLLALSE